MTKNSVNLRFLIPILSQTEQLFRNCAIFKGKTLHLHNLRNSE